MPEQNGNKLFLYIWTSVCIGKENQEWIYQHYVSRACLSSNIFVININIFDLTRHTWLELCQCGLCELPLNPWEQIQCQRHGQTGKSRLLCLENWDAFWQILHPYALWAAWVLGPSSVPPAKKVRIRISFPMYMCINIWSLMHNILSFLLLFIYLFFK